MGVVLCSCGAGPLRVVSLSAVRHTSSSPSSSASASEGGATGFRDAPTVQPEAGMVAEPGAMVRPNGTRAFPC